MNKTSKIIFYIVTGLFSMNMVFAAGMYFFQYDQIAGVFEGLGFPAALVYPLGIAKLLGVVGIWQNKSKLLKELAYAGFAIDFVLAIGAHLMAGDGQAFGAVVALVLATVSFILYKRGSASSQQAETAVNA